MRNGWNWKYPLSYMYPAHTQLLAKCSSPSIGDRRATGCKDARVKLDATTNIVKGTTDLGVECLLLKVTTWTLQNPVSKLSLTTVSNLLLRCQQPWPQPLPVTSTSTSAKTRPCVNYAIDWLDPFSCVFGHFRHGDEQPNEQTTGWS